MSASIKSDPFYDGWDEKYRTQAGDAEAWSRRGVIVGVAPLRVVGLVTNRGAA